MIKLLFFILWIIDISNMDIIINDVHLAEILDTLPINTLFWWIIWIFGILSK